MKKRTLLSMLLAGIMAVSLVGCGDDGKSNNNNNFTDKFQPTSTDTAVNGTEATTDVAEKPTEVETPTPEPEKNVITLMSADGKKVIHEFDIPDGYTVVSDKKSNHVELAKDGDDTIKVEIISGLNPYVLSAMYAPCSTAEIEQNKYLSENGWKQPDSIDDINYKTQTEKENTSNKSGIDIKYFNETVPDTFREKTVINPYKYMDIIEYPETWKSYNEVFYPDSNYWDSGDYNDKDPYMMTYYYYKLQDNKLNYIPVDETFTIKLTVEFDEKQFNEKHGYSGDEITLSEKLYWFTDDSNVYIEKLIKESDFNLNTHKCDHCK